MIAYAEVNPDYTRRPEPDELLPVLEQLFKPRGLSVAAAGSLAPVRVGQVVVPCCRPSRSKAGAKSLVAMQRTA